MQHHSSSFELQAREMLMAGDDIHEVGELDPENVGEGEEFGSGCFVEVEGFDGGEEGGWDGLGHASSELAPDGASVVHVGVGARPRGV